MYSVRKTKLSGTVICYRSFCDETIILYLYLSTSHFIICIAIVLGVTRALLLPLYTQSGKMSRSSGRTNCESHI